MFIKATYADIAEELVQECELLEPAIAPMPSPSASGEDKFKPKKAASWATTSTTGGISQIPGAQQLRVLYERRCCYTPVYPL